MRAFLLLAVFASQGFAAQKTVDLTRRLSYQFVTASPKNVDYRPVFSPSGGSLVFEHQKIVAPKTRIQLWRVSRGGGNLRALVPQSFPYLSTRPNWSARNGLIAFTGQGVGGNEGTLWVVRPDGTGLRQLTSPDFSPYILYPHWFPSGVSLAVVNYNGNGTSAAGVIQRVRLDPNDLTRVTAVDSLTDPSVILAGEPAVSPDGRHIAMAAQPVVPGQGYDQKNNSIWIIDVETLAVRKFDNLEGRAPTWSPDGRWITFESNRASSSGAEYAIYAKRFPRGRPIYQLTPSIFNAQHAAWSPNGRYLTCSVQVNTNAFDVNNQTDSGARGLLLFATPPELRQRRPFP